LDQREDSGSRWERIKTATGKGGLVVSPGAKRGSDKRAKGGVMGVSSDSSQFRTENPVCPSDQTGRNLVGELVGEVGEALWVNWR